MKNMDFQTLLRLERSPYSMHRKQISLDNDVVAPLNPNNQTIILQICSQECVCHASRCAPSLSVTMMRYAEEIWYTWKIDIVGLTHRGGILRKVWKTQSCGAHIKHVMIVKVYPGSLTFVNFIVSSNYRYMTLAKNMRIFLVGIIDMKAA